MPASPKIITKLRERRQIEAGLRQMLAVSAESEFRQQAQQIAALGPQVIPTLIDNLDDADDRMLVAMGAVSVFLNRDDITNALRQAVLQSRLTDQGRIGALTILERFLGIPPDDDLLSSLQNPEAAAIASLEAILDQAATNPALLVDYVEGLDRQEPDVVLAVIGTLRRMPGPNIVEPLRMMAQDVRGEIAVTAVQALGELRTAEATHALQTLVPITAPDLRPQTERALRKLRFAGVPVQDLPEPDPRWRALIAPPDGLGRQSIWFILEEKTGLARFLNLLLSDRAGAVEALGHANVPIGMLPPRRSLGYLHDITPPDGSGAMLMLESTFDRGRRWVLEALEHNRETQIPVAGPLRLLSPWLWASGGVDRLPPLSVPELAPGDEALVSLSDQLLNHPAFTGWTARGEAIRAAAEEALRHPGWDPDVWVRRIAGELFSSPALVQILSQRMMAISEWLLLAGEERLSRLALVTAQAMLDRDASELPFVRALVRRDLDAALRSLKPDSEE
ncbi:MAG: hypothetical protein PVJ85_00815 [Anaerolineae bacterium]